MVGHRRGVTAGPRSVFDRRDLVLVAVGGAFGATVRWAVVEATRDAGSFPWWTLLVNVAGCLVLGLLRRARRSTMLLCGIGFCGGLTTFSTFSLEVALLLDDERLGTATGYLAFSLVLGLASYAVGRRLVPPARAW